MWDSRRPLPGGLWRVNESHHHGGVGENGNSLKNGDCSAYRDFHGGLACGWLGGERGVSPKPDMGSVVTLLLSSTRR